MTSNEDMWKCIQCGKTSAMIVGLCVECAHSYRAQRDELLAAATKVIQAWWYKNAILTDVMRELDKVVAKVQKTEGSNNGS